MTDPKPLAAPLSQPIYGSCDSQQEGSSLHLEGKECVSWKPYIPPPAEVAAPLPEPQEKDGLTDVYEVYGGAATSRGWDFLVCKTMKNALENIEASLDLLEEGEEVKIVFRRYTAAQMEDVVYE